MPARTVELTDRYDRFVDELVRSGRFVDAADVLRAGLRLLEQQSQEDRERLAVLRSLADEGLRELDQGLGIDLGDGSTLAEFVADIGRRAAAPRSHGA